MATVNRQGSARTAGATGLVAGALVLLALAPATRADWSPAPGPGGEIEQLVVADAETWLVQIVPPICCAPTFRVTDDGGQSWTPFSLEGFEAAFAAGAAADRTFRIVAWRESAVGDDELQVFRVDPAGGAELLGGPIGDVSPFSFNLGASVSPGGETWVPFRNHSAAKFTVAVVVGDGSSSSRELPQSGSTQRWEAEQTILGPRLLRYGQEGAITGLFMGTFKLEGKSAVVPAEAYPVGYMDGEFWLSRPFGRASWDAGAHWTESDSGVPVPRSPGLGMPRFLAGAGGIAERHSSALFRRTGLDWPSGVAQGRVMDAGSALIASDNDAILVHRGALPPFLLAYGQLEADTRGILDRANQFRADAGLPPLTGDALVSRAARNHSLYTSLNGAEADSLSAHDEVEGRPGFSGGHFTTRCAFVGTACIEEIMYSHREMDPVAGWLATPFHRALLGSPESGVVGAARVDGGAWVAEFRRQANLLIRPLGFPSGRWRGAAGFAGEIPDPVARCNEAGQPIAYPVGIAVALYSPVPYGYSFNPGPVTKIEVRRRGSSQPLPGCLLGVEYGDTGTAGMFILDDPLVEGETYDARGSWVTGSDIRGPGSVLPGAMLSHEWSFVFQPEAPVAGTRRKSSRRRCAGRRITRLGSAKRDVLRGTKGRDVIAGLGGNDLIRGFGGNDLICGGSGRDRMYGGGGRDSIWGHGGRDGLFGGRGKDRLFGGGGRDSLAGGSQRDLLRGGKGRDREKQ